MVDRYLNPWPTIIGTFFNMGLPAESFSGYRFCTWRRKNCAISQLGHKYENGNAWVVNGFRDFKGALGGHDKLTSKYSQQEYQKARADYREKNGGAKGVRGFLRIMLATYTY